MPKIKTDSATYFKIGAGSATLQASGAWLIDARRKSIPKPLQSEAFPTKAKAKARLLELQKEYPKNTVEKNLEYFSKDELDASRIALEEAYKENGNRPTLHSLVKLGIEAKAKKDISDLFTYMIEDVKEYEKLRRTARGNKRGSRPITPNQRQKENKILEEFYKYSYEEKSASGKVTIKSFSELKTNEFFDPDLEIRKKTEDFIWARRQEDGSEYSTSILNKTAKVLIKFFDYLKEEYSKITESNPLKGLDGKFNIESRPVAPIIPPKKVRQLFEVATTDEKWIRLIPYMTFLFFSGRRPQELADPNNVKRRMQWKSMNNWEVPSSQSGGLIYDIPAWEENDKGETFKLGKKSLDATGDLLPSGVKWLKWYFIEIEGRTKLPNDGEIHFNRNDWEELRDNVNLFGDGIWDSDSPRHGAASAVHRLYPEHKIHWLTAMGHSETTFLRNYNNPKLTEEKARELLQGILPPPLQKRYDNKMKKLKEKNKKTTKLTKKSRKP